MDRVRLQELAGILNEGKMKEMLPLVNDLYRMAEERAADQAADERAGLRAEFIAHHADQLIDSLRMMVHERIKSKMRDF